MTPMQTPTHRLADTLLGDAGPLSEWVATRRENGHSWRFISLELRDSIGLDVTHETLRSWFPQEVEA